jgi:hypothetical protein
MQQFSSDNAKADLASADFLTSYIAQLPLHDFLPVFPEQTLMSALIPPTLLSKVVAAFETCRQERASFLWRDVESYELLWVTNANQANRRDVIYVAKAPPSSRQLADCGVFSATFAESLPSLATVLGKVNSYLLGQSNGDCCALPSQISLKEKKEQADLLLDLFYQQLRSLIDDEINSWCYDAGSLQRGLWLTAETVAPLPYSSWSPYLHNTQEADEFLKKAAQLPNLQATEIASSLMESKGNALLNLDKMTRLIGILASFPEELRASIWEQYKPLFPHLLADEPMARDFVGKHGGVGVAARIWKLPTKVASRVLGMDPKLAESTLPKLCNLVDESAENSIPQLPKVGFEDLRTEREIFARREKTEKTIQGFDAAYEQAAQIAADFSLPLGVAMRSWSYWSHGSDTLPSSDYYLMHPQGNPEFKAFRERYREFSRSFTSHILPHLLLKESLASQGTASLSSIEEFNNLANLSVLRRCLCLPATIRSHATLDFIALDQRLKEWDKSSANTIEGRIQFPVPMENGAFLIDPDTIKLGEKWPAFHPPFCDGEMKLEFVTSVEQLKDIGHRLRNCLQWRETYIQACRNGTSYIGYTEKDGKLLSAVELVYSRRARELCVETHEGYGWERPPTESKQLLEKFLQSTKVEGVLGPILDIYHQARLRLSGKLPETANIASLDPKKHYKQWRLDLVTAEEVFQKHFRPYMPKGYSNDTLEKMVRRSGLQERLRLSLLPLR